MRQVKTNTMRQTERLINRLGLDCNFVGNSSVRVQFVGGSKQRTIKIDSLIPSKQ